MRAATSIAISVALACTALPALPAGLLASAAGQVGAPDDESLKQYVGRPISAVTVHARDQGDPQKQVALAPARERLARNHIRTAPGTPFDARIVVEDQATLSRLSGFGKIQAFVALLEDQTVVVRFVVENQDVIADVQTVGNRLFTDEKLAEITAPLVGSGFDEFQISSTAAQIEQEYRAKGYFLVNVTPDREELAETGVLLFNIREGGLLKVSSVKFQGVTGELTYPYDALYNEIRTREIGILERGRLDHAVVDADVAALTRFYRDRGYLDVDVSRHVGFAPNGREAQVTFIIKEGRPYTLRTIKVYYPHLAQEHPTREQAEAAASRDPLAQMITISPTRFAVYALGSFSSEQVSGIMEVKPGDVYSEAKMERGLTALRDALGQMGHVDATVQREELRDTPPYVDLLIEIKEGPRVRTGEVVGAGNTTTKHSEIRRLIRDLRPDRPLSRPAITQAQRDLRNSPLFGETKVTVQPEDPDYPGYRDILVEIQEQNTASLEIGGLVGSDAGVTARIAYTQKNFDITNPPNSARDLLFGNGFRGGGQTLQLELLPGTEVQTYTLSLTDPSLLDSDYSAGGSVFYRNRFYRQYDELRYGTGLSFGRTFGSRWKADLTLRAENIDPTDIDPDAPVDYFDVEDSNTLTAVGIRLTRTTVDDPFFATRGNRIEFQAEQVGALGGDFTFSRFAASYGVYLPLYEDYFGRSTVLSLSTRVAYIPGSEDDVPFYERIYYGGTSFRGFSHRAIAPLGIRNDTGTVGDDTVGGTWGYFLGAEIRQPIYQDILSVVGFIDSGTVTFNPGFDDYRVTVGTGIRLKFDALTPVPLAFDFAIPLLSEEGDRRRLLTFSIDIPFQ